MGQRLDNQRRLAAVLVRQGVGAPPCKPVISVAERVRPADGERQVRQTRSAMGLVRPAGTVLQAVLRIRELVLARQDIFAQPGRRRQQAREAALPPISAPPAHHLQRRMRVQQAHIVQLGLGRLFRAQPAHFVPLSFRRPLFVQSGATARPRRPRRFCAQQGCLAAQRVYLLANALETVRRGGMEVRPGCRLQAARVPVTSATTVLRAQQAPTKTRARRGSTVQPQACRRARARGRVQLVALAEQPR